MPVSVPALVSCRRVVVALAAGAVASGLLAAPTSAAPREAADYVVVLKDSVGHPSSVADEHRRRHGAEVSYTYGAALKGYAARLSGRAYADVVNDPRVAYVERDGLAWASETQSIPVQADQPWGLDRLDQRALPLSGGYTYSDTATAVTAYVLDTGILSTHEDLAGRVGQGWSAMPEDTSTEDCNGHGTHVAGTIGGATYGVAKGVQLVPVRVLGCDGSGSWSGVIAGVDWVTANATGPAVANMSLGGGAYAALDDAVANSIRSGVAYAVAAGNGNHAGRAQDACNYSPARVPAAMTVSATDETDTRPSFANYGACVDVFAPGVRIESAWWDGSTDTISGTSMAAPHVAGAAALHLSVNPSATPQQVRDALVTHATQGIVGSASSANAHLLYVGPEPQPATEPTTEPAPVKGGGPKKR